MIHQAGMMDHEGVQLCQRCGIILTDYRGAMVPEGQGPLHGWVFGESIEVVEGNPRQLWLTGAPPDCQGTRINGRKS